MGKLFERLWNIFSLCVGAVVKLYAKTSRGQTQELKHFWNLVDIVIVSFSVWQLFIRFIEVIDHIQPFLPWHSFIPVSWILGFQWAVPLIPESSPVPPDSHPLQPWLFSVLKWSLLAWMLGLRSHPRGSMEAELVSTKSLKYPLYRVSGWAQSWETSLPS